LKQYSSKTLIDIGLVYMNTLKLFNGGSVNRGGATFTKTSTSTYYSQDFDTLDDCLAAIQDPTTTYTQNTVSSYAAVPDGKLMVPATNICCFVTMEPTVYGDTKRISPLETIVPIPTEGV
jgi:hypothetical protein